MWADQNCVRITLQQLFTLKAQEIVSTCIIYDKLI